MLPQLFIQHLRTLNLSGVSISADVQPDGTLLPIGGESHKLSAAALTLSFPRIHTVVVAQNQPVVTQGLVEDPRNPNILKDPNADFHILFARTLADAVDLVALDAQTRWGTIIDCTDELRDHHNFVGRQWLKERIHTFLNGQRRSSYVLVTGEPGAGKSAFMADWVRTSQFPAYHFIKKGRGDWDNPDAFFRSLTAQLRRKYLLPSTDAGRSRGAESQRNQSPADEFYAVLEEISRHLAEGEHELLWLDGLDEAYGPTGRAAGIALPGVLRTRLPDGIFMVLTSRPGEHLNWLADATLCDTIAIEDEEAANEADVCAYFEACNRTDNLGLSAEFITAAVRRSENNFLFAVKLVDDLRALPPDKRTPDRIPESLRGWMVKQLEYVVDKWKELND